MTFVMADVQMLFLLWGDFVGFPETSTLPCMCTVWGLPALHSDLKPGRCMTSLCPTVLRPGYSLWCRPGSWAIPSSLSAMNWMSQLPYNSHEKVKVTQSFLTLCNLIAYSPPGSSVHGISQARMLEWIAMPTSRASSQPRDWTQVSYVSCIVRRVLYHYCHLGSLI